MKVQNRKVKTALISTAFLGMLVLTIFFYIKYQEAQSLLGANTQASQAELNEVITKIGRHMVLPTSERPTLATVSEVEKLRSQKFFQNAENGDKVLVYVNERKAILYRPRIDKIVEVSPVELNSPTPSTNEQSTVNNTVPSQQSRTPPQTKIFNVDIRNASTDENAIEEVANRVVPRVENISIQRRESASSDQIGQTTVYALSEGSIEKGNEIASVLSARVERSLPPGFASSQADILIVIGTNSTSSTEN